MPQPTPYTRQFGFTDWSTSYPTAQQPGTSLDAEFNAAKTTLDGILTSLALLQRDDGALKNQIVTVDSLSPEALLVLGAGVIWLPRGAWATATAYAVSDVIQNGTASYVCAVAHTSAALFATDLAAGRWVLLFDSAGSTPADASVTAPKIAAGAVTADKIGFTSLDLSGNIRGGTGLQAGTGTLGELLHAKAATGAAMAKVERTTDAQGRVGYQVIGVSARWDFSMAASASVLDIRLNNAVVGGFTALGGLDMAGTLRATTGVVPASGSGAGIHYAGGVGYLTAYNYTTPGWLPLKVRGSTVNLTAEGVDVVTVTATGTDTTGTVKRGGVELGWLDLPQNPQNGAYTLALTDRGKHIYSENVAGQTIAIPANATVAFPVGSVIVIVNNGTNPITIDAAAVTLWLVGTGATGNRTIAAKGMATLLKLETNEWLISGTGVS